MSPVPPMAPAAAPAEAAAEQTAARPRRGGGAVLAVLRLLVCVASGWPIGFNTRYGARNIDGVMVAAARLSGVTGARAFLRVLLPAALPAIMTGVRLAAAVAVVLTIVTELVASGTGLGAFVSSHQ